MQGYQILLLKLLLLAFLYVAALVYVASNLRDFNSRLKRRERALMILMNEKTDLLLGVLELFRQSKVELTPEDKQSFIALGALQFDKIGTERVKFSSSIIHEAHNHIEYILQNNAWLRSDLRVSAYRDTYDELDHNFRQSSAIYNADVGGYMYWFKIPTMGLAVRIFGFRARESIN